MFSFSFFLLCYRFSFSFYPVKNTIPFSYFYLISQKEASCILIMIVIQFPQSIIIPRRFPTHVLTEENSPINVKVQPSFRVYRLFPPHAVCRQHGASSEYLSPSLPLVFLFIFIIFVECFLFLFLLLSLLFFCYCCCCCCCCYAFLIPYQTAPSRSCLSPCGS